MIDEHPEHEEVQVHFTRSIDEKPLEPNNPRLQRRPTSGKGLLLKSPIPVITDSSDEDEGENVPIQSVLVPLILAVTIAGSI